MAERIERKSKAMAFMLEWYDAMRPLPADVRLAVYDAVTAYGLGEDPGELSGVAAAVFTVIRADIDRRRAVSERCREAGRKGAAVRWARARAKAEGRGTGDEVQAKAQRPRVTPSQTLHAFLADERRGALERLAASYGVTLERLRRYAELVAAEWEARGTTHRTLDEAFNHMLNTLRKKHAAALDGLPAALPRKTAKPAKTAPRKSDVADGSHARYLALVPRGADGRPLLDRMTWAVLGLGSMPDALRERELALYASGAKKIPGMAELQKIARTAAV